MRKKIWLVFFLLSSVFAQKSDFEAYLNALTTQFEIPQILPDSVNFQNAVLLDSREKSEYEISHIRGARWVGYDDFDLSRVDSLDRDKPVIVYCSVGYRSSVVGEKLIKAGFKNVKNLYGGIFKWANEDKPLMQRGKRTYVIHTFDQNWGKFLDNERLIKLP